LNVPAITLLLGLYSSYVASGGDKLPIESSLSMSNFQSRTGNRRPVAAKVAGSLCESWIDQLESVGGRKKESRWEFTVSIKGSAWRVDGGKGKH
jgi:hypothetical protein